MHYRHAAALAGLVTLIAGQLIGGAPAASAQPVITTIPEAAPSAGRTVFTDDPTIIDSRPQGVESWSRLPDSNALEVHFTSGTPECHGVHADVQETADIVAVKLRSGTPPAAAGRACILIAVPGSLTVPLDAPLGDRAVVSIT